MKEMVSFWTDVEEVYNDDGLILIKGYYDEARAIGLHWNNQYPSSHNRLTPFFLNKTYANALLTALLHKALTEKEQNPSHIASLNSAIQFITKISE
ncbi:hypothetical protein [Phocoenobacter skyensis]|uniref:Uncharacterized protein n=1 Tax=Phocoenobacter skyensis TaxID=97481 RepID=A0A1H7XYY3_9PAST|nr:hypothetical protein [Pasteurella skyensis]MDP8079789.1 hypothetical protein [Pasteurella skyensis]MDP8085742.1 hypothetical protein [Pasteurella skyensis]MDP8171164.1 hypothetical protein [Pasteurella skyensis]MDP8175001.1 hypothetical protein [Pasteurella skyensis]MDP8176171.1 hypothetical protein [Pasteurella skyensis]